MKRFQFTIRELLLFIMIAALAAGWWIDHQRISSLMVQKWEYKVDNFHWDISTLDAQGAQGWELCGMSPIPDNQGGGQTVAFKRPVR